MLVVYTVHGTSMDDITALLESGVAVVESHGLADFNHEAATCAIVGRCDIVFMNQEQEDIDDEIVVVELAAASLQDTAILGSVYEVKAEAMMYSEPGTDKHLFLAKKAKEVIDSDEFQVKLANFKEYKTWV